MKFCAFSRDIAKELTAKAPSNAEAATLHSHGLKAVNAQWGRRFGKGFVNIDGSRHGTKQFARAFLGDEPETADDRHIYSEAVKFSKARLAITAQEVQAVMEKYSLIPTSDIAAMAESVAKTLESQSTRPCNDANGVPSIEFDDMIWLPVRNGWAVPQFDLFIIDEAQDLNPCQAELAKKSVRPGVGNIVFVGDPFQAIMGFAGADPDSFQRLAETLNAKILPLTCTRRCAASIVELAKQFVPDYECPEGSPMGTVKDGVKFSDLPELAKEGDVIISRTNAPLCKLFMKLIKLHAHTGTRVCMLGRDFGKRLESRIKNWGKEFSKKGEAFSVDSLLDKNAEWCARECAKIEKRKGDTGWIIDQTDAIASLCEDLPCASSNPASVCHVLDRCKAFVEDKSDNALVLSSTHKFKGLEKGRVFLLWDTYLTGKNAGSQEEKNLAYVGITRAKNELALVYGAKAKK